MTSNDTVPCSLPLATEPASIYREYAPPPALQEFLICTWTLETRAGGQPHQQRVLPDGCSDIVWFGETPPVVVGPMTRPVLATTDAQSESAPWTNGVIMPCIWKKLHGEGRVFYSALGHQRA